MIKQHHQNNGAIAAILFSLFVVMSGYGVLLPVLPFFVERLSLKPGIDQESINFHVGALTSVYPLFQLIFAVIWGKLSDRFGRKNFIMIGLLGFILMQFLIGLSTSLTMFYIARIIGGIFTSAVLPISNAYLSDITSKENRSKIMAWSGAAISTGLIAGPVAGGLLSKTDFHISVKMDIFHLDKFSIPFFALIIPGIVALLIILKALKKNQNMNATTTSQRLPVSVIRTDGFSLMIVLALSFILQFTVASFETVFSIYAKNDLLFNAYQISIGFMLCGLVMAVFQPVFTSIKTKTVTEKLVAGFLIMAISLFVFPFMKANILVYNLIILFAIGGAMIAPQLSALVSLQDHSHTAKNLSYQTSVNSIGQILGPLIGIWLVGKQVLAPFIMSSTLLIISVLVIIWTKWRRKKLVFSTKG